MPAKMCRLMIDLVNTIIIIIIYFHNVYHAISGILGVFMFVVGTGVTFRCCCFSSFKALVWSQFNLQLTKQPQHDHNMGLSPKWANAVHQQTNQYRVTATLCLCCLPIGIMTIDCLIYLNGVKFTSCHHGHWANDILRLCKSPCPLYHCVLIWVHTFSLLPSLTWLQESQPYFPPVSLSN